MSNYYYDHQNSHQHDAYAMQNYPSYHAKLEQPDGYYQSPQPLLYNEFSSSEKFSRANNRPRSCCDRICCGCCTCCPRWCRWISCILLLLIIGLAIAIGVLAALFKEPSVEFTGIQGQPAFGLEGTTANLNISLGFTVKNPNIESVTFKTLTATANYHGDTTQLGTGTLNDLHIGSNSITNISFPFNISLNLLASETQTVVTKLMSDCGLSGGTAKDIQLDYKVVATVSIIGIPISIPFSSSASFKCPIDVSPQYLFCSLICY
ncbi:uncharacterized protein B0P05DRAFT_541307 [Gilbertella persicaria]|uniref:uncharacterized protein n=1 Tax=Gilbertella persicaria TaxID=101096 RepID=UPI002220A8EE|nr:uncharacterized protein B0P05DRAFT_541307 [Gilbertella persicaria]KAI8079606.1 hypothetical protein B0P05DRAFT_541307 [Gilbertella persicaria]